MIPQGFVHGLPRSLWCIVCIVCRFSGSKWPCWPHL
jgi:hypothetical protein